MLNHFFEIDIVKVLAINDVGVGTNPKFLLIVMTLNVSDISFNRIEWRLPTLVLQLDPTVSA